MRIFPIKITKENKEVIEYDTVIINDTARIRKRGSARKKLLKLSDTTDESIMFAEIISKVMDMETE
jgi:hypothetical protein